MGALELRCEGGQSMLTVGKTMPHEKQSMGMEDRYQGVIRQWPDYIRLLEHVRNFGHYPKFHG